jgi:hypothetical protein
MLAGLLAPFVGDLASGAAHFPKPFCDPRRLFGLNIKSPAGLFDPNGRLWPEPLVYDAGRLLRG